MANRYAIASGNWSNPAIWDGGTTTPTTGDTVRTNTFIVTIDQNISVTELRTDASSPAVAGGQFQVSATGLSLTWSTALDQGHAGVATTAILLISSASGTTTINGNLQNSSGTASSLSLSVTGAGGVTINGVISGAANGLSNTIVITGGGLLTVTPSGGSTVLAIGATPTTGSQANTAVITNGNLTVVGRVCSANFGVVLSGTNAVINITGDVGSSSIGLPGISATGTNASVTVTGNVTGGNGNNQHAISVTGGNSTVTVTGNVLGGAAGSGSGYGISTSSNANLCVTVNGNVTAGSGTAGSYAINNTSSSSATIDVTGNVTGGISVGSAGINAPSCITRVGGNLIQSTGRAGPIHGPWIKKSGVQQTFTAKTDSAGFTLTGTTENLIVGSTPAPAVTDVRSGVSYGSGPWVGTLAIPPTNSVASGVQVDATTGTAALILSDVASVVAAQVTALG